MNEASPISNARFRITSTGQQILASLLEDNGVTLDYNPTVVNSWAQPNLKAIAFYSQFIKREDLCFDIGAHVGDRTSIFRKLGAKVIAVEPLLESNHILTSRFTNDKNVTILRNAVGEDNRIVNLYTADFTSMASLLESWGTKDSSGPNYFKRVEQAEMITVDSLLEKYGTPAFIKIDIEGYERQALKAFSRPVKALSFEFHPHLIDNAIECIHRLSELGRIQLNLSADESFGLELSDWVAPDEMIKTLHDYRKSHFYYGDIYARYLDLQ